MFFFYPLHLLLSPSFVLFYSRGLFSMHWQTPQKSSLSPSLFTHNTTMITIWLGVSNPVLKLLIEVLQVTTVVIACAFCLTAQVSTASWFVPTLIYISHQVIVHGGLFVRTFSCPAFLQLWSEVVNSSDSVSTPSGQKSWEWNAEEQHFISTNTLPWRRQLLVWLLTISLKANHLIILMRILSSLLLRLLSSTGQTCLAHLEWWIGQFSPPSFSIVHLDQDSWP